MTLHDYDVVALTEDLATTHLETQAPMLLRRGQVGTVLMVLGQDAFLVDFADEQGYTYAMATVPAHQLMPLLYAPIDIKSGQAA